MVKRFSLRRQEAVQRPAAAAGQYLAGFHVNSVHVGAFLTVHFYIDEMLVLNRRDRRILEFERQWWKYAGAKEQGIRDLFEMSGTRYYQILNGLIDDPEALAADPMLVKRLRRMRSTRQRARSARRLGIELETR